jgi:hypothetical protein
MTSTHVKIAIVRIFFVYYAVVDERLISLGFMGTGRGSARSRPGPYVSRIKIAENTKQPRTSDCKKKPLMPVDLFTMREGSIGGDEGLDDFVDQASRIVRIKFVHEVRNLADEPYTTSARAIQKITFLIKYLLEQRP